MYIQGALKSCCMPHATLSGSYSLDTIGQLALYSQLRDERFTASVYRMLIAKLSSPLITDQDLMHAESCKQA